MPSSDWEISYNHTADSSQTNIANQTYTSEEIHWKITKSKSISDQTFSTYGQTTRQ